MVSAIGSRPRRFTEHALLLVALAAGCRSDPPATPTPDEQSIDGRWLVGFYGPLRVQLPIVFAQTTGSDLEAEVLANWGVALTDGVVRGSTYRMNAGTPQGDMKFRFATDGDDMIGTWSADHLLGQFLFHGGLVGIRIPTDEIAPLNDVALFDSVWSVVNHRYYSPEFGGVDWQRVGAEQRARFLAARNDVEAFRAIDGLLDTLHTSHLSLSPDLPPAIVADLVNAMPPARTVTPVTRRVVDWREVRGTGYIRIAWFPSGAAALPAIAALDSAFAELGHLPALVIDLRGNPGGHLDVASRLADHLADAPLESGYYASREGVVARGARSIDELDAATLPRLHFADVTAATLFSTLDSVGGAAMMLAGGRGADAYDGVVGVLVDGNTGSTAEAVAIALRESGRAIVIGRQTAGAMLASSFVSVARGWTLQIPIFDFRSRDGARVEGAGVTPDVPIDASVDADDALARAIDAVHR